jgi:virginiamycin B lyase
VPTRDTVMHRIVQGPDGNVWFTELNADKVGRLTVAPPAVHK